MDADKIKNFFILHAEKMVVGLVVAASAWMVYGGLNLPDMRDEQNPDSLASQAQQVRSSIDDDHNENILPDRQPVFKIDEQLVKKSQRINEEVYNLDVTLEPINIGEITRRQDPTLVPPRALITSAHIASYAVQSSTGNYRAAKLENAEALKKIEQKAKPKPKKPTRGRGMMGMETGMGMEMGMGMDMDMEMESGMDSGMMDPSMMGSGSMEGGMTGAGRQLAPEYNFGYKTNASTLGSTTGTAKKPVPQSAWFIAGTAVIPHREIAQSYKAALFDAAGYRPDRDQPVYFNYEIQRATVTNKTVDQLEEADWVLVGNREMDLKRAAFAWAGFAPEIIPSDYRDLNITGYIPPILIGDYSKFAMHPLIPMISKMELEQEKMFEESQVVEEVRPEDMRLADPNAAGNLNPGMGGEMDFGMDSTMDYSMDSDMGMSMGMGVASGMSTLEVNPVEFKIMRFYDFYRQNDPLSPVYGQKYVYRIRYAVQDPNFPANKLQQPKSSTLSSDVYTRVQGLMTKAEETKTRDFQRWSPWSEVSPPATLPGWNDFYAGSVSESSRGKEFEIGGKKAEYFRSPPKANVVNLSHHPVYSSPMPIWLRDVTEGSTLSFKGVGEIIDPITLSIKKVEDAEVLTGSTIIDIDGYRPLSLVEKDGLTEPGLILMFDEFGGLRVQSEVNDQEEYRIFSFAEDRGL